MTLEDELRSISDATRKYLMIADEDVERVKGSERLFLERLDEMVEGALKSLLSNELAQRFIERSGLTKERTAKLFRRWLTLFVKGGYDLDHAKQVFKIGLAHARYGVYDRLVCMCAGAWLREILKVIGECDVDDKIGLSISAAKLIFWNLIMMLEGYHVARVESLKKSGIPPKLAEKLFMLKAEEVYKSFKERL
ncbi:MAG: hypothetical protein J7J28_00245 [Thaumarchaeota archaeon]|nr:hypothetical protein [Nitrososphaerota archaeon]